MPSEPRSSVAICMLFFSSTHELANNVGEVGSPAPSLVSRIKAQEKLEPECARLCKAPCTCACILIPMRSTGRRKDGEVSRYSIDNDE